jgi:hypothetical protein
MAATPVCLLRVAVSGIKPMTRGLLPRRCRKVQCRVILSLMMDDDARYYVFFHRQFGIDTKCTAARETVRLHSSWTFFFREAELESVKGAVRSTAVNTL